MNNLLATCSGGIIFTGESVRGIRELRKTRTMRVINPQPSAGVRSSPFVPSGIEDGHGRQFRPRYQPGKRYYVKETWCCKVDMISAKVTDDFYYRLDNPDVVKVDGDGWTVANKDGAEASPWLSPMRMPKRAARYVIEIDDVKVMCLQGITEEEARAEGFETGFILEGWSCMRRDGAAFDVFEEPSEEMRKDLAAVVYCPKKQISTAVERFALGWDAINKRAPWSTNPWVFSHRFHLVQP